MNNCYNNIGTKVLDISFRSTNVWFETGKKSYEWGFAKQYQRLIWDCGKKVMNEVLVKTYWFGTCRVSCCEKGIKEINSYIEFSHFSGYWCCALCWFPVYYGCCQTTVHRSV
jgi:hypothetical protein